VRNEKSGRKKIQKINLREIGKIKQKKNTLEMKIEKLKNMEQYLL